jgi:hypothetical protein
LPSRVRRVHRPARPGYTLTMGRRDMVTGACSYIGAALARRARDSDRVEAWGDSSYAVTPSIKTESRSSVTTEFSFVWGCASVNSGVGGAAGVVIDTGGTAAGAVGSDDVAGSVVCEAGSNAPGEGSGDSGGGGVRQLPHNTITRRSLEPTRDMYSESSCRTLGAPGQQS